MAKKPPTKHLNCDLGRGYSIEVYINDSPGKYEAQLWYDKLLGTFRGPDAFTAAIIAASKLIGEPVVLDRNEVWL